MKKIHFLYVVLFFLCNLGIHFAFQRKKTKFDLKQISSPFVENINWTLSTLTDFEKKNIQTILKQEFNYLGSGAECFVFLSADGKYVLKFFKMKHLLPKNWLKLIPFSILKKYKFRKMDRRILRHQEVFMGYKMAYEELREQTGLVYLHLNKSKDLQVKTRLYDRMKKCYQINLDEYEFVLQKKSQPIRERIIFLMQEEKREAVLESIYKLFRLVVFQCKKGFIDQDSGISHNYGFVKNQAIHFDVGRLIHDETAQDPICYQQEVLRVGEKLEKWLKVEFPMLLPDLEEAINAVIDPSFQM